MRVKLKQKESYLGLNSGESTSEKKKIEKSLKKFFGL